jgi:hypothetical protein
MTAKQSREERQRRVEQMLTAERDAGFMVAFRAGVEALVMFATEQAGIRGMTKATHMALKNRLGGMVSAARCAYRDDVISFAASEAAAAHAREAYDEAVKRLGLRGSQ